MTASVNIDPAALAALFEPWNRSDAPGIVAGVSHPRAGSWRAGYGVASLEIAIANTPRTRMRIGSTSKMFTCLGVFLLAEDGRLSVDDPIRKFVPELPVHADGVTLRHLMTHTSGLRCHIDVLFQTGAFARPAPAEAALETMARQGGVNFPVGERYAYNNGGYNLLSTVIERVTGEDFGAYQASRIFRPLGMLDTAVKRVDTELLPNSASLHVRRADGGFERGFFGIPIAGEGAMVSTVEDLLAWQKHWHRPTIGAPETWRQMRTPARLNSGRSTGYGPGLRWSEHRGLDVAHHAGGVLGGVCMALTVPALEFDVILIANRGDAPVQTLAFEVVDACVEGLSAPPTATGTAPVGTYWSAALAAPLEVGEADGQAFAQLWDTRLPMRRTGEGRIACSLPAANLVVEAASGEPDRVAVEMGGSVDLFERVRVAGDDPAVEAVRLAGSYRCEDADAVATVTCDGDRVRLRMAGPFGRDDYALRRFSPLIWISTLEGVGIGAVLEFIADAAGTVTGFATTTSQTRRLPFARVG